MDMFYRAGATLLGRAENYGFTWDEKKAEEFLLPLYEEYKKKKWLYFSVHNEYRPGIHVGKRYAPQHEFRPNGVDPATREHDIFLAFTNQLDFRTDSRRVYRAMEKLWEKFPEMFTEEAFTRLTKKEVEHALRAVRYTYPNQGTGRWISFARTLYENFGGDPLAIFKIAGVGSIDEMMLHRSKVRRKKPHYLSGKGPKLLSLLAMMYEEFERIPAFPRSFPVDLHVQRTLNALGVISWDEEQNVDASILAEYIRINLVYFFERYRLSVVPTSHMIWFLGNALCTQCHELRAKKPSRLAQLCPMYQMGCKGPKYLSATYSQERQWSNRMIIISEVPKPETFGLVEPVFKEPRRKKSEKKARDMSGVVIPDPDDFELDSDGFI